MNNELKAGDTIPIPDDMRERLTQMQQDALAFERGVAQMIEALGRRQQGFWDYVRDKIPETRGYRVELNTDGTLLTVLSRD